jgi:hypothetical protein
MKAGVAQACGFLGDSSEPPNERSTTAWPSCTFRIFFRRLTTADPHPGEAGKQ